MRQEEVFPEVVRVVRRRDLVAANCLCAYGRDSREMVESVLTVTGFCASFAEIFGSILFPIVSWLLLLSGRCKLVVKPNRPIGGPWKRGASKDSCGWPSCPVGSGE